MDDEKEMLKRIILEHEGVFRGQVHELHRLWRVQRDLMLEYERNPLLRNNPSSSSSSPIHTNVNHSTNGSNNPLLYSAHNRPNFEFVREGSAQSSANIVAAKNPAFDLRLSASEYIKNENGLESGFGFKLGAGRKERNFFLSDLNEPVEEAATTGLDFLGVNRDLIRHRQVDEGSSSGVFFANGNRANEELFLGKEKGIKPSGTHFFSPSTDRNHHLNFVSSSNSLGSNVFSTYQSHQNSFNDRHSVAPPQLFGQKLTYTFNPSSQAQSSIIFSSNNVTDNNYNYNYNSNNPVAPLSSFPILDSSPHCNKNKGLMLGSNSMHPLSTFVNNASGGGAGDNSGFFLNAPPRNNLVFGKNFGGQSIDFSKSSWKKEKNIAPGVDMDLNEPVPEENQENQKIQETKGIIKLFGTNCGSLVSEPSRPKNEIDLNNVAVEDEPNGSNNTKLLGFPFFNNSSCSNNKSTLHADESNKSEGRVNDNNKHVESAKRVILIDLNEDLPLETDPDFSNERRHEEGKKVARFVIDLEMPASEFDDADTDTQQLVTEREDSLSSLSSLEAADTIVSMSKLKINNSAPPSPDPGALLWLADVMLSDRGNKKDPELEPEPEPSSESEDLFESMTLKLEEIKADERFVPNEFKRFGEEESSSQAGGGGEAGFTSLLFTRGGRARKRRQRRDFQRDVLPTIASLSRVEVTEDLQMIGGLMRACGQEFESALTRRAGRNGLNGKGKRQQRSPHVNQPQEIVPVSSSHQVKPEQNSPHNHSNSHESIPKANLPQNVVPDQCQQPKKITIVNHTHRFNPPHGSPRANGPQRIVPVANSHQQTLHQNPDIESEGLSVVGWGRTTVRRNRRPRNSPLISNNPPMPLN